MSFSAGDITEMTYNHPTLGSGVFYPKAGEDGVYDKGGFRNSDDANMIAGNGQVIKQVNQVRWMVEATLAWDMADGTLEKLEALAKHPDDAEWTFTHSNGTVDGGTGSPVGDIKGNSNNGTVAVKLSGGGMLKKQG